ncbi:MAG TPA: HAMP domain-containing sensor histidine kinase [Opitutales bacterium]|jgi:signal transduction histidine kinase|nr:HAMP domain-containing sensor histidine kinase [Opitutales bacterium]
MEVFDFGDGCESNPDIVAEFVGLTPAFCLIVDKSRRILYANQSYLNYLGIADLKSILNVRFGESIGCEHSRTAGCGHSPHCQFCQMYRLVSDAKDNEKSVMELTLTNPYGKSSIARVWSRTKTINGQLLIYLVLHDISDERRRDTLNRMFYHDILNAIGGVSGLLELIDLDDPDMENNKSLLGLARICNDYLTDDVVFSRALMQAEKGELALNLVPLGVNFVLNKACGFFTTYQMQGRSNLIVERLDSDRNIITDKSLIVRVLINLIKNAIEADGKGAEVRVKAELFGDKVVFSVFNKAVMSDEAKENIFIRSFTTKGKGHGVGTYSVKLFTEEYLKGRVWFTSREGEGTAFHVEIPVVAGAGAPR